MACAAYSVVAIVIVIVTMAVVVILVGGLRPAVARVAVVPVLDAAKARGQAGIAGADIGAALGIGAERALELHALRRDVVDEMRGDDLVGCDTLLHPALERLQHVVIGVNDGTVDRAVAERIDAGAAAAMRHARHHEDAIEVVDVAHLLLDAPVVVEAVLRRDRGIGPAGILDHLAAVALEGAEVGIDGAHRRADGARRRLELLGDVAVEIIAGRRAEYEVAGETDAKRVLGARRRRRVAGDPGLPVAGGRFAARLVAREEQIAAVVMRAGIDLLGRRDLRRREASARVLAFRALDFLGIEMAAARIAEESVAWHA